MANCGIKKYDALPARVGWMDVDYLRYLLKDIRKDILDLELKRVKIVKNLEAAYQENKKVR